MSRLVLAPPKTDDTLDLLFGHFFDMRATAGLAIRNRMDRRTIEPMENAMLLQYNKFGLVSDPSTKIIEALLIGRGIDHQHRSHILFYILS